MNRQEAEGSICNAPVFQLMKANYVSEELDLLSSTEVCDQLESATKCV